MTNEYLLGVNYWASHAGIRMWSDWDEETVEKDLASLETAGVKVLRVFPLWSDFQPLTGSVTYGDSDKLLFRGEPIGLCDADGSGVDPVMLERFRVLADKAHKHGMTLIVALITGWMSGRMFHPDAFTNLNFVTNDVVIKWQIRFIRTFVRRFKDHPAILAWSPGNETNVMCCAEGRPGSRFWVWLNNIVSTIRAEDPAHQVVAGMHGLKLFDGPAQIEEVGEVCDYLTVHPYPAFVPHCFTDGLTSMKAALHAASESALYEDVGGKPCFGEEVGTLGPMLGNDDTAAVYLRRVLYSTYANGYNGMLWWCGFDQDRLRYDPYQRCSLERELGLFTADHAPKKVAKVVKAFSELLQTQAPLPPKKRDAVCLLTLGQDNWAVAYATNLLAKQAGFDVKFACADRPVPDAPIYLLPSMYKDGAPLRTQQALLEKVQNGATLYLSVGDVFLSAFAEMTGMSVLDSSLRPRPTETITRASDGRTFTLCANRKWRFSVADAEVLATEADGNPALTRKSYGKGTIYFLSFPIEQWLADQPHAFDGGEGKNYYALYKSIFAPHLDRAVTEKSSHFVEVTEHPLSADECEIVAVSYENDERDVLLTLAPPWHISTVSIGRFAHSGQTVTLLPSGGLWRFTLSRK